MLLIGLQYPDEAKVAEVIAQLIGVRQSYGLKPVMLLDPEAATSDDYRLLLNRMGYPTGDLPSGGDPGENVNAMLVQVLTDGTEIQSDQSISTYGAIQYMTEFGFDAQLIVPDETNTTLEPPGILELGELVDGGPARMLNGVSPGVATVTLTHTYSGVVFIAKRRVNVIAPP